MIRPASINSMMVFVFGIGLLLASTGQAGEGDSKARPGDQPPRKVIVGTMIERVWDLPSDLDSRLNQLRERVEDMAETASKRFDGRSLDLVIFPETIATENRGPIEDRSQPLDGPIFDAFAEMARDFNTYVVATLYLAESAPDGSGPACTNAAVLFDRAGEVVGTYRKVYPVAPTGTDSLEGGVLPGSEFPVFDCDFGKLGIQICFDINYEAGWSALADAGAEIVAWPSASPATVQPSSRALRHRYYVVSSTWRNNAAIFEPTGMMAAQIKEPESTLVHEIDLSFCVLPWSPTLRNGEALLEKFGDRVGFHYSEVEDCGLFWSNDPEMPIGEMVRSLGLEEYDPHLNRNLQLQDQARGRSAGGSSDH